MTIPQNDFATTLAPSAVYLARESGRFHVRDAATPWSKNAREMGGSGWQAPRSGGGGAIFAPADASRPMTSRKCPKNGRIGVAGTSIRPFPRDFRGQATGMTNDLRARTGAGTSRLLRSGLEIGARRCLGDVALDICAVIRNATRRQG
jgi:hypothetical protein